MQMRELALGIDIGTTAIKAVVVDRSGRIIFEEALPHELCSPKPGYAEEDPLVWWENTKKLLSSVAASVECRKLGAVGFSGMVPTLILLDRQGEPLYPSIQQNDARAVVEIAHYRRVIEEERYLLQTGNTVNQQLIFPKYRWLQTHHPGLIDRTSLLMGSYNYCTYKLTGTPTLERNWALESGMWLLREKRWLPEMLRKSRIEERLLPPVYASTQVVGASSREVERETGFPAGIPVIAGSADHVASALASGVQEEGDLLLKLGGAGDILFATRELRIDRRLFIDYHGMEDRYLLNGCMASSGSIVKWFSKEFGLPDLAELDRRAAELPAGSSGLILLPYFVGEKTPIFDLHARGVYFGLSLFHTRHHLFRAILEAVAFGFLHHLEVIQDMGFTVRNVYLSNGGAKSELWKRIVLDAVGSAGTYIPDHPGSCLGVAFMAAQGAGITRNWEALQRFLRQGVRIPFDPNNHLAYRRYFELYKKLYLSLKPLFKELAQLNAELEKERGS
jgi:xylulokinase